MRLTKHFTLEEFLVSETASRKGLTIERPIPTYVENLAALCTWVLEPLRASYRKPISIISGYRPEWLNKLVGGSVTSDHMFGQAADFIISGVPNIEVCHRIIELNIPYKQLIHEFPPGGWVHISFDRTKIVQNQELLTALKQNKRTIYIKGLYNA